MVQRWQRLIKSLLLLFLLLASGSLFAASTIDVFHFDTPEQEQRYRALIEELRCPKCMNTNIAGSDALSAQTLRAAVHRMVVQEGKSDAEILAFMQDRYGDFVLYDPPLTGRTWLVWALPIVVALLIVLFIGRIVTRARTAPEPAIALDDLDAETKARLQSVMSNAPQDPGAGDASKS